MFWKEHGETIKSHLVHFYDQYQFQKDQTPNPNIHEYAESYIKNEIAMEEGMQSYFDGINEIHRRNSRILRAIKSIKGKAFYRHLVALIKDANPTEWHEWEIVSEPSGKKQNESEFGRSIKFIWVDQWSVGTEGDSFEGYIEVQLKENKYLKFRYSC
jgi:hypothetical protein